MTRELCESREHRNGCGNDGGNDGGHEECAPFPTAFSASSTHGAETAGVETVVRVSEVIAFRNRVFDFYWRRRGNQTTQPRTKKRGKMIPSLRVVPLPN